MRGDQAFDALAAIAVGTGARPLQHLFQNDQQIIRHIEIRLIAGMVEGDQDLVR